MNFTRAVSTGFSKYATFKGRASKSEFWWFMLFTVLCAGIATSLYPDVDFSPPHKIDPKETPIAALVKLVLFVPQISVLVRRLHDVDKSGWWVLSVFPPCIFIFFDSTPGENRFGPNPNGETIPTDISTTNGIGLNLGDVVYTKIEGIRIFEAPDSTSPILMSCLKGQEFIYKGEVNADFIKVSNGNSSGWVEAIAVNKKIL